MGYMLWQVYGNGSQLSEFTHYRAGETRTRGIDVIRGLR